MLKKKLNWYWKGTLMILAPILILVIILATVYGILTDGMSYMAYNPDVVRLSFAELIFFRNLVYCILSMCLARV